MSKPQRKIVVALLESYFGYRSEITWGLTATDDDKIALPADPKQLAKINSIVNVLHALGTEVSGNNKKQFRHWMHVIKVLHEEELAQAALGGMRDYLAQTLRAIRSYILQQISENKIFLARLASLELAAKNAPTDEEKAAAQKLFEAFNDKTDHFTPYFTNNMLGYDKATIALEEKDVEAFKANAMDEAKRPAPHIARLLRTFPVKAEQEAPAANTDNNNKDVMANDNSAADEVAKAPVDAEAAEAAKTEARLKELKEAVHLKVGGMRIARKPKASHSRFHKPKTQAHGDEAPNQSREYRRVGPNNSTTK